MDLTKRKGKNGYGVSQTEQNRVDVLPHKNDETLHRRLNQEHHQEQIYLGITLAAWASMVTLLEEK